MSGTLSGTLTGPETLDETGTTTISSTITLIDNVSIVNEGTLSIVPNADVFTDGDAGDEITNDSGATFNTNGLDDIDATLSNSGAIDVAGTTNVVDGIFTNTGTISFSSGNSVLETYVALDVENATSSSGTIVLPFFDELAIGEDATLTNSGTIELEGDDFIAGYGSTLENDGVISVTGSGNDIAGNINGTGTVQILAGGTLGIVSADIANTQGVALAGVGATLYLDTSSFSVTITKMEPGAVIDFGDDGPGGAKGTPLTGDQATVIDGNLVLSGVDLFGVTSVGWSAGSNPRFTFTADGVSGIDATLMASAVSDFFGSGTSDILWQNSSSSEIAIWEMSAGIPAAYETIGGVPGGWQIAGSGDFTGDGMADILWQNQTTGQAAIWLMNGASATSYTTFSGIPGGWVIAGVGDFNGDGDADILWRNPGTTQIALWEMTGATPASETTFGTAPSAWQVAGVADFNGDGYADILWQNTSTQQVAIWEMNGSSVLAYTTIATAPSGWQIAGTGDFAGNFTQDILWENTTTDQVAVWQTNGTSLTGSSIIASGVPFGSGWAIAGVGDYTGSGADSILWQNSTTGQAALWQTNGTTLTAATTFASGIPAGWQVAHNPVLAG